MDEMRTMMAIALNSRATTAPPMTRAEIKAAGDQLIAAKGGRCCLGFAGGVDGMNKVLSGEAVAAVVYNGDAAKNMPRDGSIAFAIPRRDRAVDGCHARHQQGAACAARPTPSSTTSSMPRSAPSSPTSTTTPRRTPHPLPLILPEDHANTAIYPTDAAMKTLEVQLDVGKDTRLYDEIWTRIKAR